MSWSVIFPGQGYQQLRSQLLAHTPEEAGAILLCHRSGGRRLLVETAMIASPEDCRVQGPDRLEFEAPFLARAVKRARDQDLSLILVHTHPFDDHPRFSRVDDHGESVVIPAVSGRAPTGPHGALVLGTAGFQGRLHAAGGVEPIEAVVEVGPRVVRYGPRRSAVLDEIHDRNVRTFGAAGQQLLTEATVGIVGLGGTGSLVAEQLARLGVGTLVLIDDDTLAATNLNRVAGAYPADVGHPKVEVAANHVARITGGRTAVTPLIGSVLDRTVAQALLDCDFVMNCTDTHGSRAVINQLAYQHWLPAIDMGVRIDAVDGQVSAMAGRVQMLAPGLACLQCDALLDPEAVRRDLMTEAERRADPYIVGEASPQPSVISLNGTVSSLAVTTFLAAAVGLPIRARRMNYRVAEGALRAVSADPNPECIVCSASRGAYGQGDRWPMFWRQT